MMKAKKTPPSNVLPFSAQSDASPLALEGEYEIDLNEFLIRDPENTIGITVSGNSGREHGLEPGDFIIVNKALTARPGDVVLIAGAGSFGVRVWRGLRDVRQFGSCGVVTHIIRSLRSDQGLRREGGAL